MRYLSRFWIPVDWFGDQIRKRFTPQWQIRVGVLMLMAGCIAHVTMPFFPAEPPVVYQMSAFALTFGGIGAVVTAVLADKQET